MTILIAGDSWGCGEWNIECSAVLHKGLEQYLVDDGYTVINLSKGGISNLDIVNRLTHWFERFDDVSVSKIFIFQTEFTRDFKHDVMQQHFNTDDWCIESVDELASIWIERFYQRLSELAQEKNCKVYLLGGVSDTIRFDSMENDYPMCNIACQSVVNLLVNNDSSVNQPVFSWFLKTDTKLIEKLKKFTNVEKLIEYINLGIERESVLTEHPELFYPDGRHPNRNGHKILYDFLKRENLV